MNLSPESALSAELDIPVPRKLRALNAGLKRVAWALPEAKGGLLTVDFTTWNSGSLVIGAGEGGRVDHAMLKLFSSRVALSNLSPSSSDSKGTRSKISSDSHSQLSDSVPGLDSVSMEVL
jgi:hypothetical protein